MADIQVISGDGRGKWRVVFHFDVPAGNNAADVPIQTALANSGLVSVSVMTPGDGTNGTIDAAEVSALAAGTIYEHVVSLPIDGGGATNASRLALLRERYAAIRTEVMADLQSKLDFFGVAEART